MISRLTRLSLAALLFVAFFAGSLSAQTTPLKPDSPVPSDLDNTSAIRQQLEDIKKLLKDMESLQRQVAIAQLTSQKCDSELRSIQRRVEVLEEYLPKLIDKLDGVQKQMDAFRTSQKQTGPAVTETGTLRLVNVYSSPVTVRINGKDYAIAPGVQVYVEIPAGVFTYELVGYNKGSTSVLSPNETKKIRVFHPE